MRNKRGMIHVEVALAFVIFLVGISLSVFFFTPVQRALLHKSVVFTLKNNFLDNTTSNIYSWDYNINSSYNYYCLLMPDDFDKNHIMLKSNGNRLPFNKTNSLCSGSPSQHFVLVKCYGCSENENVTLMYSKDENLSDFHDSIHSSVDPNDISGSYIHSPGRKQQVISWNKLLYMNESYYNDYASLKSELVGTANVDFNIIIRNSTSTLLDMSRQIPENVRVSSDQAILRIQKGNESSITFFDFLIW